MYVAGVVALNRRLSLCRLFPQSPRMPMSLSPSTQNQRHRCHSHHPNPPANLEHILQKQPAPPPFPIPNHGEDPDPPNTGGGDGLLLETLNLPSLFSSFRKQPEEIMSPRTLTRLLSDSTRPSPRGPFAFRWRHYHGANDWAGLLNPLDENLRRELIRCGDLIQTAYHAFHSHPDVSPDAPRPITLPDCSYHAHHPPPLRHRLRRGPSLGQPLRCPLADPGVTGGVGAERARSRRGGCRGGSEPEGLTAGGGEPGGSLQSVREGGWDRDGDGGRARERGSGGTRTGGEGYEGGTGF